MYPNQPGGPVAPAQGDAFQDPRAMGEPGPAMSELNGHVIAVVVKSYDPTAMYQAPGDKEGPKSRPCVVGDLYVFGQGSLNYGGSDSQTDPKPPTHTISLPAKFTGRYFAGVNVVSALRDAAPIVVAQGGQQMQGPGNGGPVIGLVEKSTFGGKPWNLTKLEPGNPERGQQFAQLRSAAGQQWGQQSAGILKFATHAENGAPIPGQGGPVAGANPYGAAPAQAAPYGNWPQGAAPVNPQNPGQQAWGQGMPQAAPAQVDPQAAAFAAWQAQQAAALAAQQAAQAPAPVDPQQAAFAAWQASQATAQVAPAPAAYVPAQGAAPAVEQDVPVPGYEAVWATMLPEHKAAIRGAAVAQQATQGRPLPY